jgi:hypothetical protein
MKAFGRFLLVAIPWVLLVLLGGVYLWNRMFSFPWVWEEHGRVTAPSRGCEVVTYEGNRGAMSSFAYVSFLVKPGTKADPNACNYYEPILSSSHVPPKVRWVSDHKLLISPEGGYVTHQRPYSREFEVFIEIENGLSKKTE